MTFSISARCPETGTMGMAISSSSPAVAARCAHAGRDAGVVATQNITDPDLGLVGLSLLGSGLSAGEVLQRLVAATPFAEYRQLAIVDRQGGVAGRSGVHTLGVHAIAEGPGCIAAGNLLADPAVPRAMVAAFVAARGPLADRLLAGLKAGLAAGGEAGPVHSAGLKVVREMDWPVVDLRVDWSEDPIGGLAEAWAVYAPQLEDYVRRAVDPRAAPSFGVPGDA